jgi:hypothetical protein
VRVVPNKFPFFRNPTPPELAATHLREADSTWNYPSLYSRNGGI